MLFEAGSLSHTVNDTSPWFTLENGERTPKKAFVYPGPT